MNPEEVAKIPNASGQPIKAEEVCLRAVSLLKTTILNSWVVDEEEDDKENVSNSQNQTQSSQQSTQFQMKTVISLEDRKYIKDYIFKCMDMFVTTNKKISSELEHIVYNIAENDIEDGSW